MNHVDADRNLCLQSNVVRTSMLGIKATRVTAFQIPLVIKLHWTRQAFNSRSQKSYDEYKAGCRCQFILRRCGERGPHYGDPNTNGSSQKTPRLKKVS